MSIPELRVIEFDDAERPVDESWQVTDLGSLDWTLSRIADLEREVEENDKLAALAIDRIKVRTEALNERAQKGVDWFRTKATAYVEEHKSELLGGGKKKSRTLLHGIIGWRKTGGKLEVKEPEVALEWARSQPVETGVLRIVEQLDKKAVNAIHEKTGEVPPGCDVSPDAEELKITAILGGMAHE